MSEPSFLSSPSPSAFFDPESWCWRTSQGSFQLDLDEEEDATLLERLPDWGTTSNGVLYELQTPGLLIAVRDGSALLGTPRSFLAHWADRPLKPRAPDKFHGNLEEQVALLPTPSVNDSKNHNPPLSQFNRNSLALPALMTLFPTPAARDWKDTGENTDYEKLAAKSKLAGVAQLLLTPQHWDHKVFGPNVDWKKRAENHADSVASVLMNLPLNDGSNSSGDEHQTQLTTEGSDQDSSNG